MLRAGSLLQDGIFKQIQLIISACEEIGFSHSSSGCMRFRKSPELPRSTGVPRVSAAYLRGEAYRRRMHPQVESPSADRGMRPEQAALAGSHLPRYAGPMSNIGHTGMWRWSRIAAGLPM
jgi:hypothetical protein